jgi:hypothetical protein
MGKQWTDEERKAFGEKMKALKAKKTAGEQPKQEAVANDQTETTISNEDYQDLKQQIEELKARLFKDEVKQATNHTTETPTVTARGIIGTFEKYITNPARYPDPVERLSNEPKLKRFAFKDNYELNFAINVSSYETQDGRREKQPKFTLQLIPIIFGEDGEDHGERYIKRQVILHEDPDTALVIAKDNGLDVEDYEEKAFLDEMRYLRMRDWLFEEFLPRPVSAKKSNRQQVINNQVVDIYEINSPDSAIIPFQDLRNKLRG